ncbi:MAG TPA: GNAT family N-acetyltransferase [Rickettsiales bacterium]|nr:GNAT family N-acetyltransferase [Rickettsiales bacterium]
MITLEKYDLKYTDDFVEYMKEFQRYGDEFGMMDIFKTVFRHCYSIEKKYTDFSEKELRDFFPRYAEFMINCEKAETIEKKDWVEADSYFICKDGKMIGEINFRKRLNVFLLTHSMGHIGYKIKQSERGNGYGTEALRLLLEKAWKEGYTELMISCKENNIPSSRVIEKNGGILNRINKINEKEPEKEYWIFNPNL